MTINRDHSICRPNRDFLCTESQIIVRYAVMHELAVFRLRSIYLATGAGFIMPAYDVVASDNSSKT